jgi:hypothetical protein
MSLKVVQAPRPAVDDIIERLEKLLVRARAGELETLYTIWFGPGGQRWDTGENGKIHNRLEMVGILEGMKLDLMRAQDVDDG